MFSHSSRGRLTEKDLGRFTGHTLFDRVARAVCQARCLPRKELYESWEVARRVRRLFRGGRVVDLGGGHGLLALMMLILDDSSPTGLVVDKVRPPSSARVHEAILESWPRMNNRVTFVSGGLDTVKLQADDVVVSSHACGRLTDVVLDAAIQSEARVAVLPCCHDVDACDAGGLAGWLDPALAIDVTRAVRLQRHGFRVWTQSIPSTVTPKNRLLIGAKGY